MRSKLGKWCLFHFTTLRRPDGKAYMRRLQVLETPWFSMRLHYTTAPDLDRHLHDHPFTFLSFLLWGCYVEELPHRTRIVRWWNFCKAEGMHRLINVTDSGVLTLVFTGARRREWGYAHEEGWMAWTDYHQRYDAIDL